MATVISNSLSIMAIFVGREYLSCIGRKITNLLELVSGLGAVSENYQAIPNNHQRGTLQMSFVPYARHIRRIYQSTESTPTTNPECTQGQERKLQKMKTDKEVLTDGHLTSDEEISLK